MIFEVRTRQRVEITAESPRERMPRLEAQRQALERELAAVVAHAGTGTMPADAAHNFTAPCQSDPKREGHGRLTEWILRYVSAIDVGAWARDVAAAPGRDSVSTGVDAMRRTLDRLVAAPRRGLCLGKPARSVALRRHGG
ncbi:hypothetical protein L1I79_31715 [Strepomyces sp. STD 3.1]|nr:hypothetical protein [Streptomyces sp. STD 3.1]